MSVLFDRGARRLLERAYAKPGEWVGTRLADPSPAEAARAFAWYGINVLGPDNAPTASGQRQNAHTRWGRGFVRALYYQHRWHSGKPGGGWRGERRTSPRTAGALRVEWGARKPALGVIPAGRAVRVQLAKGGQAAMRAAKAKEESARIYDDRGNAAGRWSDPMARDWLRPEQSLRAVRPVKALVLVADCFSLLIYGESVVMPQIHDLVDAG